jgi:predicted metalloprotease with PDZ domain
MQFRRMLTHALVASALLPAACALADGVITYKVEPLPHDKTYQVTMDIPNVHALTIRLQLPVWSPGAYMTARGVNIADVKAETSTGSPLNIYHPDPNIWEVAANGADMLVVHYKATNADLEEANGVPKRGHIVGPRTYLYVDGRKTEPVELILQKPLGAINWPIAISLDPAPGAESGPADYTARNYDVLADAPVEMGDYLEDKFVAGGKPHSIVLFGDTSHIDRPKLLHYCKTVAETEDAMMGDVPFSHYVFMFRVGPGNGGGGGLEHLGSTEISVRGIVEDRLRSVIAHEYFHLWNVKRIRPFVLGPFDYQRPPHTANLWWSEGVTSYYGDLLSRRGGINTDAEYFKHLADTITELQNNPARLKVSAEESSQRVWEANNSQGYGNLSYYTKGELVGLCLDLKIREVTDGRKSLDDVMRALYAQCGRGLGPGFGEDDIKATVNRVSGRDLSDFYDTLTRSMDEMPFADCLSYVGLSLGQDPNPQPVAYVGMGIRPDADFKSLIVADVEPDSAAAKAGIKAGDHIVGVNGQSDLMQMAALRTAKPGTQMSLTIERGGSKMDLPFTMGSKMRTVWTLVPNPGATTSERKLREQWLTGK